MTVRCFRSAYSEWIIDEDRGRYMRRPAGEQPDVRDAEAMAHDVVVPYEDGWRELASFSTRDIGPLGELLRLRVVDPSHPAAMHTTAIEVYP